MTTFDRTVPRTAQPNSFYRTRRFSILLLVLLGLLVVPPISLGFGISGVLFDGIMTVLVLVAILSLCMDSHQRLFALVFGIPTVLFTAGGICLTGKLGASAVLLGHLSAVIFLFGAAALIVGSLFSSTALNFDRILGAICGYIFLGLGWAMSYGVIESFQPGSFELSPSIVRDAEPKQPSPQVLTYYSFVTLTTVGYGDVIPASAITRTLAWIEAISGQFYLAVIVAGLVSMFRPPADRVGSDSAVELRTVD